MLLLHLSSIAAPNVTEVFSIEATMKEHEFLAHYTVFPSGDADAVTSATYLNALIDHSPIAIVVLDAEHRYRMCNPAFERLFQYTTKELSATDLDLLIAGPESMEIAKDLSRQVLRGSNVHTLAQRRRRDGMMVDVEIYGIPLIVENTLVGVYGLYQDVTERNEARTAFRRISNQFETLQQEERSRLARDLHDSTSQELAVLNWNLARLTTLVEDRTEALQKLVRETSEIALQCSTRIRSAAYLLHPPLLGQGGLTLAMPWLAENFERHSGIAVTLQVSANLGRFREEIEIAIFRVVQEALANVLRHSQSPVVCVALRHREGWLELVIADEGKGHTLEVLLQARDRQSGIGISGMRERVERLGGCFKIACSREGTTLTAVLPTETTYDG